MIKDETIDVTMIKEIQMRQFRDLRVWQKAHQHVLEVYRESASFPREDQFGLTSQLRRAAVSIPCNIAEGSKRIYPNDFGRFLNYAEGSCGETDCLFLLSADLGFMKPERSRELITSVQEISKMLCALRERVVGAPKEWTMDR